MALKNDVLPRALCAALGVYPLEVFELLQAHGKAPGPLWIPVPCSECDATRCLTPEGTLVWGCPPKSCAALWATSKSGAGHTTVCSVDPGTRGSQRARERSLRVLRLCQRQPRVQELVLLRMRMSHRPAAAQDCVRRETAEGPQAGEPSATVSRESPLTFWCNAEISILPANSSLRSWNTENWTDWDVRGRGSQGRSRKAVPSGQPEASEVMSWP